MTGPRASGRGRRGGRRRVAGGPRRRRRLVHRLQPPGKLQEQLPRVEFLRAPPIDIAPKELELVTELGDELLVLGELGEELQTVLPQVRGMLRQGGEHHRHRYSTD